MSADVQAIEKQLQFWQDCKKAVLIAEQAKTIEAGHQQVVDRLLQKSDVLRREIEERQAGLARFAASQQAERDRMRAENDAERASLRAVYEADTQKLTEVRSDILKAQRQLDLVLQQKAALERDVALVQKNYQDMIGKIAGIKADYLTPERVA